MANDEFINQIADKLQNHTSEVNPQMWQAVSSQIGTAAGASSASTVFGLGKVAAIAIGTTAVAVASYFAVTSTDEKTQENKEIAKVVQVEPTDEKSIDNENIVASPEKEPLEQETNVSTAVLQNEEKDIVKVIEKPVKTVDLSLNEPITSLPQEIEIPVAKEPIQTIKKSIGAQAIEDKQIAIVEQEEKSVDLVVENEGSKPDEKNTGFGITKLPNVFSPNNDGVNDYLTVETKGLSNYSLVVLDKNNNKVWQTTEPNAKWDGRDMAGQFVEPGEYLYFVAADGPNGEKIGKYQRLTVTR